IMAYRDRSRFLPPQYSEKVFDRNGNSMPVVMGDGRIIGIWMEEGDSLKVMVLEDGYERAIMDKAIELGYMLGLEDTPSISPYPDEAYVKTLFKLGRHD
ncbi:MAG: winged helix DNA-binding domain-containing protein, partial [Theionarchaea archaeon]|nr:winged helix DNA-binding domain-containing protein [Theionarchaea archaeon]